MSKWPSNGICKVDSSLFSFVSNFRLMNMSPYGNVEISQLVTMLVEARNIDEQVID